MGWVRAQKRGPWWHVKDDKGRTYLRTMSARKAAAKVREVLKQKRRAKRTPLQRIYS